MSSSVFQILEAFDPSLPLSHAKTIPAAWYHHPAVLELERRKVFGNSWQMAGRLDQVARPGDYFIENIASEPILVVRGEDGVLRAFHNVCRHRAARVMNEPCGHATKLRCRYHGWTYNLAGELHGVPEFDGVEGFPRERNGLPPLAVDVLGPMVFVHLGKPTTGVATALSAFANWLPTAGIDRLSFAARKEYELECNWKVFVDNYQDGGYHVNTVHPGLAGAIDYKHYRTENFELASVQISPLKPADDAVVGRTRTGIDAHYWWLFPNLMVNVYQGVMDVNLVFPISTDRCRVIFDFYFADVGPSAQKFIDESIAVADQVQKEDIGICEEVQIGLRSSSYDTGRFSVKRESGGYHFHQTLARFLRSEGDFDG